MSTFMERARSLYDRGEHVRTAFVLAEGLKRDPTREDALHWFLQVYVEDVGQPGLEQELVRVVETQPNGAQLLDLVCEEMRERQQFDRLNFLNRVRTLRDRAARAREDLADPGYPKRPAATEATDPVAALHAERGRANERRTQRMRPAAFAEPEPDRSAPPTHRGAGAPKRQPERAAEPAPERVGAAPGYDPEDDLPPALQIPRPPRRARRSRRRQPVVAPQGVLDLDAPTRPAKDDWGSFTGLVGTEAASASAGAGAGSTTSAGLATTLDVTTPAAEPVAEPRAPRRTRRSRRNRSLGTTGDAVVPARRSPDMGDTEPDPPVAEPKRSVERVRVPDTKPERAVESAAPTAAGSARAADSPAATPEVAAGQTLRLGLETPSADEGRRGDKASRRKTRADLLGSIPSVSGAEDADDDWSFGAPLADIEGDRLRLDDGPDDETSERFADSATIGGGLDDDLGVTEASFDDEEDYAPAPRRKRRATRAIARIESTPARLVLQTLVRLTTKKRGILLLAFVAVLGVLTAAYRSCVGMADTYLASADELLWAGTGDALREALPLYEGYLPEGRTPHSERRDLAVALLAADYGEDAGSLDYDTASAQTVEGGAASALQQLAHGNIPAARGEAEALLAAHGDAWLAHWTRGRVAVAEQEWSRARSSMSAARQAAPTAVLPLLSELDLALRAGDDEEGNNALERLAEQSPEHPMVTIGRTAIAFGVNPLDARVANLEVVLPDPEAHTLSTRALALITYVRARQALAAFATNRVTRALRGLQSVDAATAGVRGQLLFAVAAARSGGIEQITASLQRARAATPEGSPAAAVVDQVAFALYDDAQRPDLIEDAGLDEAVDDMTRARLLISTGQENAALRLLGNLMERDDTQVAALRTLVDYHLRRGNREMAQRRAGGLSRPADRAYAQARLSFEDGDYEAAARHAELALRDHADDLDSLFLWCSAMASAGEPELALERLNEASARVLLPGTFDLHRLDVLVRSGRAPRETLSGFLDRMEANAPTSASALPIVAGAYEALGDRERARETARRVLEMEANHSGMQALLNR